jgi:transposase
MIVARVIEPSSKLSTTRALHEETCSSSLGQVLKIDQVTEDELYAAMDWLHERQDRIETKLAARHLREGCLVLYDVSSSFYTGTHCSLASLGHNRDGKNGYPQIVYGLLCTDEGCPVGIEVFKGNTGDPKTLGSQIKKVRERFGIERVVLVGDRGMITTARIDQELRGVEGLDWITALRAPAIAKLAKQGMVQLTFFDERDLAEITSPDYPGERLMVCRNPLLAEKRSRTREELLQATEKKLEKIAAATRRDKKPLSGKAEIGIRVGRTINAFKVGKHFKVKITEKGFSYWRKTERIAEEAALDGIYIIRTSVPQGSLAADSTVRAYKDLSKVERAFRCLKTVDLKIRPIFHWLADRVRAHVFICMLAYYVEWHMRQPLAPLLFDDDDRAAAEDLRESIVAPAQYSPSAKEKAATKLTKDGYPVHSFRSLLKDLATLAKNRVRTKGEESGSGEFDMLTTPTALQRRAFDLLEVPVNL